ncbi:hypothetical protein JCM10908_005573 [Rhodotorula pacifica]|uniref:tRNA-dihydrouridine(20) synthase (NAD(+)) n=1 Tax=Rhodotorula pacifica TaxID=1495444 RepID=UPI003171182F
MTAPPPAAAAARPLSPAPSLDNTQPAAKRQRTMQSQGDNGAIPSPTKTPRKRTLPYQQGMHLAPMVRIGTLPLRLIALEYGAELVWGPEIVDKAIIGAERKVDPRTGVISFCKNGRSIFDCHPLEKSRLIFQLGSASPDLAVQAMKVIENDVAGVGLNCGCPKSFSLSGGMGAALLKEPEKLCSILSALVQATDLPVDAKIRLLPLPPKAVSSDPASAAATLATPVATPPPAPDAAQPTPSAVLEPTIPPTLTVPASTADLAAAEADDSPSSFSSSQEEPTLALVARIFDTGIANLTVHCRTQEMRSREPALHERMRGITEMGRERGIPVVCNGDAVGGGKEAGWGNFDQVCEKTGVISVMIARAAEANPSCFSRSGLADPISEVIPKLLRVAILTQNQYNNTKYILNAMSLTDSPTPPSRETNREYKQKMNKAKTYEDMADVFGISRDEVKRLQAVEGAEATKTFEELVPRWTKRREEILLADETAIVP